jgi:hypothetical protein
MLGGFEWPEEAWLNRRLEQLQQDWRVRVSTDRTDSPNCAIGKTLKQLVFAVFRVNGLSPPKGYLSSGRGETSSDKKAVFPVAFPSRVIFFHTHTFPVCLSSIADVETLPFRKSRSS